MYNIWTPEGIRYVKQLSLSSSSPGEYMCQSTQCAPVALGFLEDIHFHCLFLAGRSIATDSPQIPKCVYQLSGIILDCINI